VLRKKLALALLASSFLWVSCNNLFQMLATKDSSGHTMTVGGDHIEDTHDVSAKYTLHKGAGLNPKGLEIESATQTGTKVSIKLKGTVISGLTTQAEGIFHLGSNLNPAHNTDSYSFIALDGILESGKTYDIRQTNQSLNLYETVLSNITGHGTDNVCKEQAGISPLPGDEYYAFLIWEDADPQKATIVVTNTTDSITITYVVDWGGVTFNP